MSRRLQLEGRLKPRNIVILTCVLAMVVAVAVITSVTKDLAAPLGLDDARGALVRLVERGGPAAEAGIEPGDVIVTYNGKPVDESDDLVQMVTRTEPGTRLVEIIRNGQSRTDRVQVARLELEGADAASGGPAADTGVGMTLRNLTPQIRSQLEFPTGRDGVLVTGVEQASAAARAGIAAGDVILQVNRRAVTSATAAAAALRGIPQVSTGFVLVWRNGQELFVTLSRE